MTRSGYLATLDGWRCVAILAVILYHDRVRHIGPISTSVVHRLGFLGVALFFAISGLLITSRILEEERFLGSFDIKGFYLRRAFRILPAVVVLLAVLVVLHNVISLPLAYRGVLAALLFVRNLTGYSYRNLSDWFTGHCWSLSIEEQFYLVLPALLLLVRSRLARLWILTAAAILFFAWTIYLAPHFFAAFYSIPARGQRTELHLHTILGACSLAILIASEAARKKVTTLLHPALTVGVVLLLLLLPYKLPALQFKSLITVEAFFPLLVLSTVLHPASVISKILEWTPIRYVGRMSYGIYLWQQLFFLDERMWPKPLPWMNRFPLSYALTFACAALSFYLLEKPLIRLGHRLAPPLTSGRQDLDESRTPALSYPSKLTTSSRQS